VRHRRAISVDSTRVASPVMEDARRPPAPARGRRIRGAHGTARRRLPLRRSAADLAHGDPRLRDTLGALGAAVGTAPGCEPGAPPRRHRRRGPALPRTPRHRLGRGRARAPVQRAPARAAASWRGHHHNAVCTDGFPLAGAELRAEGTGGVPGVRDRDGLGEAADPRGLPEHRRVGRPCVRRGGGSGTLLRCPRGAARRVAGGAARGRTTEPAAVEPGCADAVHPGACAPHRGAGRAGVARGPAPASRGPRRGPEPPPGTG